jgi:hypothetical protein
MVSGIMSRLLLGFIVALLMQQPTGLGYITGRVLRPDGTPAVNVRVVLIPVNSTEPDFVSTVQTDNAGNYRTITRPGRYHVAAGAASSPHYYPGFAARERAEVVEVISGVTKDGVNIAGFTASGTFTWTGRVVPAPNTPTVIRIPGRSTIQTTVNPDGSFAFSGLTAGTLTIEMAGPTGNWLPIGATRVDDDIKGTLILSGRIVVDDGSVPPIQSNVQSSFSVAPSTLTVDASRPVPGRPIPLATRSVVRPDGSFALLLVEGQYTLGLRNIPFSYDVQSISTRNVNLLSSPLVTSSISTPDEIRVVLQKTQTQGVRVSGKVGGIPGGVASTGFIQLIGALGGHGDHVAIRPDGTFQFPNVSPGSYTALISGVNPGGGTAILEPVFWYLQVGNEELNGVDYQGRIIGGALDGGLGMTDPLRKISGTINVVDSTGAPRNIAPGAKIRLSGSPPSLTSVPSSGMFTMPIGNGDHQIELIGLPAGYTIRSMRWGNVDVLENPIHLEASTSNDEELRISLEFDPTRAAQGRGLVTGSISGRLLKSDGSPAAGARIDVATFLQNREVASATTDNAGNYRINDIPPGEYMLAVDRTAVLSTSRIVTPQGSTIASTDPPLKVPIHYGSNVNVGTAVASSPFSTRGLGSFVLYGIQR